MPNEDGLVPIDLTDRERGMLVSGLNNWGGPAHCTEAMARAMGFRDTQDLFDDGRRIMQTLIDGQPLTRRDWTRALVSLEINFVSDLVGTGSEWGAIFSDDEADYFRTLRKLQRKLPVSRAYLPE